MKNEGPVTKIAGMDGCRDGWLVLLVDTNMGRQSRPIIRICKDRTSFASFRTSSV